MTVEAQASLEKTTMIKWPPRASMRAWLRLLLALPFLYLVLFCVARVFAQFVDLPINGERLIEGNQALVFTLVFFLFFTPLLYGFACLVAKKTIPLMNNLVVLYMGATFFGGVIGELLFGYIGDTVLNHPLWQYRVWPKHDQHTTGVGLVMWPMYGFYLYCFHQALKIRGMRVQEAIVFSGALIAIDAMVLEVIANIFSIIGFNVYYFYYFAGDILHFTSAEIFLPYFLFGVLGSTLLWVCQSIKWSNAWMGVVFYIAAAFMVFM